MNYLSAFALSFHAPVTANTSPASRLRQRGLPPWLVACAAILTSLLFTNTAAACAPDPGGAPNKPGQCAGAGNPINVMTGNKYQREEDLPALPGVLGLEIVRHYNSAFSKPSDPNGVLGRGWRLSYETELVDRWGKIQVLQADGGRVIFDRDPKASTGCSTPDPANGTMSIGRQHDGQPNYTWKWSDGRKLHFNSTGKLDRITAATGEIVRLLYDSQNVLVRVIDPQGRSLNLVYHDRHTPNQFHGVQFIDTPVGRFGYEYGSALPEGAVLFDKRQLLANLVRVRLPDHFDPDSKAHALSSRGTTRSTTSRIYHHEDPRSPSLLTGISFETAGVNGNSITSRYATYAYDDTGRAILTTHAGDVDKVTLDNHEAGKTVLTNSLGQKTIYRYTVIADEFRLLEVRGAGCALCGEPNVRYRYDDSGRLTETTKLSENGEPVATTRAERDRLGRVTRVSKVVYQRGKPRPAQPQVRFEYQDKGFAPVLVARPSVVPGKELIMRIDYNNAGQPLRVTETGWIPTADGKQTAAPIERTVRYRYATINGRSLLTEIDGPLSNGKANSPADSDVTIFEYDHRPALSMGASAADLAQYERRDGLLTRVIAPGNFITEVLERDAALRPTKLRMTDGNLVQVVNVASDWRGAPLHLELAAGSLRWKLDYEYNTLGQVTAATMPGNLRTVFGYDAAGRRTLTVLPDGSGIRSEQDTEDRIVRTTRLLDTLASGGTGLSELRFVYDYPEDKPGKLAELNDIAGLIKRYSYNELGQLVATRSGLGITTAFSYDAAGLLANRTNAAGSDDSASIGFVYDAASQATEITAGNGVKTLRRYDDFGRKVMEADPDHGITLFRHDAAGRVVARIDESLVTTRFTYDHAGQLLAMGADKEANLVQYRYRGSHLQSVVSTPDGKPEHATERIEYERDAFGRVTKETRWLANVAPRAGTPAGFTFVTTSNYDEAGRLVSQILPDKHRLQYRYTASDVGKASAHRPGQLEAILFDDDVVVTNLKQTIAGGLAGYTMGNGARQQISLDSRGRIEQLQVLAIAAGPTDWWRRITGWFSGSKGNDEALFYRQVNRYDEDGRIVRIDRQMPSAEPGRSRLVRGDTYTYDRMNRLTGILSSDGTNTRYAYDKGGNRMLETVGATRAAGLHRLSSDSESGQTINRYAYAPGTNRLIAITGGQPGIDKGMVASPRNSTEAAQLIRDAWSYHPTGVPLAQLVWTYRGDRANRRIVYNRGKRPIEVYINEQLVARYHYNVQGERIAKTVFSTRRPLNAVSYRQARDQDDTSYFLYREQRLAAETDGAGRITAHYVYLYGKPVAKIEMRRNESWLHRLWKSIAPRSESDSSDTEGRVYMIVTDHLGTPQQVMDDHRQVVWQADTTTFGQTQVRYAAVTGINVKPFVMNLRLPGQSFDSETNLHYNYLRDYDPAMGRYTSPDPMGLAGGMNPYVYVSNSPLINVDPLGLYEEDIHYYMTYFLALAAGVDPRRAYIIATADQYIDDNPITQPMGPSLIGSIWEIISNNSEQTNRLASYHFTERPMDDWSQNTVDRYIMNKKPENVQLQLLQQASENGRKLGGNCAGDVLFGEYLHAFEDTFGHRNEYNVPIQINSGWGHATSGHAPDHTYNEDFTYPGAPVSHNWQYNEARTLEMEKEVFDKLTKLADSKNKAQSWDTIKDALVRFNAIHEDSAGTDHFATYSSKKIDILNVRLNEFGYRFVGIDGKEKDLDLYDSQTGQYNALIGKNDRNNFLKYNKDQDGHKAGDAFSKDDPNFKGVILP